MEKFLHQHRDRRRAHVGRNVARLEVAEQRMHQHAVAHLDRDLRQVLVRAVHRIARLEGRHLGPAQALELGARLRRRHEQRAVARLEAAVGQHPDGPRQVHLALRHHHLHAGMLLVGGAEHRHALVLLVYRVLLAQRHHGERRAVVRIDERDVGADLELVGRRFVERQSDRDGPEQSVGHAHAVAYAFPVRARHEPLERRETADPEHDEIALLARADAHGRQRPGARAFRGEGFSCENEGLQRPSSVRPDQAGHSVFPRW